MVNEWAMLFSWAKMMLMRSIIFVCALWVVAFLSSVFDIQTSDACKAWSQDAIRLDLVYKRSVTFFVSSYRNLNKVPFILPMTSLAASEIMKNIISGSRTVCPKIRWMIEQGWRPASYIVAFMLAYAELSCRIRNTINHALPKIRNYVREDLLDLSLKWLYFSNPKMELEMRESPIQVLRVLLFDIWSCCGRTMIRWVSYPCFIVGWSSIYRSLLIHFHS